MLEDRDYMRAGSDANHWFDRLPVSLWLVVLNALFYAAQLIVPLVGGSPGHRPPRLETYLALNPGDVLNGWVWQFLTFQLLHAGPLHLVVNCAMLYIFGRPVEDALGRSSFLKLYFGTGAFGGVAQVVVSLLFKEHFGYREGFGWPPVLGASAGVFGLIAAFATLHQDMPITLLLAFLIPVRMKAKYLLWVEAILAVFGMLDTTSAIAHAAHLGGMIAGVFYIRQVVHWHWRLPWPRRVGNPARPRQLVSARVRRSSDGQGPPGSGEEDLSADEFLAKEVDPILDKISAHGIQSLTERERKILEAARKKIRRP